MAWKIDLSTQAQKNLDQLDPQIAKRVLAFLNDRVSMLDDPRSIGEPLKGPLKDFWRYRVGDYRIIADIEDDALRILVVRVGHRNEVYRKQ